MGEKRRDERITRKVRNDHVSGEEKNAWYIRTHHERTHLALDDNEALVEVRERCDL